MKYKMNFFYKVLSTVLILLTSLSMSACDTSKKNNIENTKSNEVQELFDLNKLKIPSIAIISKDANKNKLFSLTDSSKISEIGKLNTEYIKEFVYNKEKGVYVFILTVKNTDGESKDIINIKTKTKNIILNNAVRYLDVKLSKDATKILFRSFNDNDLSIPNGIEVYDIKTDKKLKLNKKVLVSGNIYNWIDNDNIIYYGSILNKPNSSKIYKYNLKTNKESVYIDKFSGYCKEIFPINQDKFIILEQNNLDNNIQNDLYYLDIKNNIKHHIFSNLYDISNIGINKSKDIIYLIGDLMQSNNSKLFSIDLNTLKISQLTYDLPKNVQGDLGIAIDKNDNVIFVGTNENSNNDVYVYNKNTNSINLITENSGQYRVSSSN